jgi:putative acetyltransferase
VNEGVTLRRYRPADEDAAVALWLVAWQQTYPDIDFAARLPWWRARWRGELVPHAAIVIAEIAEEVTGFVTVDPRNGYLDQIVIAPHMWGQGVAAVLMAEARRLSPGNLDLHVNRDNARAIGFYRKHGFAIVEETFNPQSGRPTYLMTWRGQIGSTRL